MGVGSFNKKKIRSFIFCVICGSLVVVCTASGTVGLWFITTIWLFLSNSNTQFYSALCPVSSILRLQIANYLVEEYVVRPLLDNVYFKEGQSSILLCRLNNDDWLFFFFLIFLLIFFQQLFLT